MDTIKTVTTEMLIGDILKIDMGAVHLLRPFIIGGFGYERFFRANSSLAI